MKRYVVFTALVGGYDSIRQPLVIDDRFEYIVFSNEIAQGRIGIWKVKTVDYYNLDSTRVCRYVKTHPEHLLPGYDFFIWVDCNIQIRSEFIYSRALCLFADGVKVSALKHPFRSCAYDECFAVVNLMVEHEDIVLKWGRFLKKEKYPKNNGLAETGVLFRVNNDYVGAFDNLWWDCISSYSRRDQLSFNYCLWKLGINSIDFLGAGRILRDCSDFFLSQHKKPLNNHCEFSKNEAWLMRYCWKHPERTNQIKELYYRIYSSCFPFICARIMGQVFRVVNFVENRWKKN